MGTITSKLLATLMNADWSIPRWFILIIFGVIAIWLIRKTTDIEASYKLCMNELKAVVKLFLKQEPSRGALNGLLIIFCSVAWFLYFLSTDIREWVDKLENPQASSETNGGSVTIIALVLIAIMGLFSIHLVGDNGAKYRKVSKKK